MNPLKTLFAKEVSTPIGTLTVLCDDTCIIRLLFSNDNREKTQRSLEKEFGNVVYKGENALGQTAARELCAYFAGELRTFSVQPAFFSTKFNRTVWEGLLTIPYGEVVSYSGLAARCGLRGARAVGSAVGRNPVPIIVPCHRVIRTDGGIGGFGGGLPAKKVLLHTEGVSLYTD